VVIDAGRGGVPVVFLHSLAGRGSHWSSQLTHLQQHRRVLAIELPGHGSAPMPANGDYSLEAMGRAVAATLEGLDLGQVVAAGHSFGGGVALEYASTHPDNVVGLFLLDPISDGRSIPASDVDPFLAALDSAYSTTIEEYWTGIAGPNASIRQRLLEDLRATPREVVVKGFRATLRYDPATALSRLRGPAMSAVTPQNDMPTSLHRLGRAFPHRVIRHTGHWIQLDQPELVNQILDQWLATLAPVDPTRA
jgi:pimeloyl-ACP methyl ester carboxylesterase